MCVCVLGVTVVALLAVSLNSELKEGQRQSYDNSFGEEAVQLRVTGMVQGKRMMVCGWYWVLWKGICQRSSGLAVTFLLVC